MMELRQDPVSGHWSIVDAGESFELERYEREAHILKQRETCQFCPGHEGFTPPEIVAIRQKNSKPNAPGWSVRVVPNKFPALRIEGNLNPQQWGVYATENGIGGHEVLIETPVHDKNLADFSTPEMLQVVQAYQNRFVDLTKDRRFRYLIIFKNYGESAGATVEHPHSQIIALPLIPKYVQRELDGCGVYFKKHGRCVYCDMIQEEYRDKERIITENEDFLAFCPFVPRYPFECWVIPKKHMFTFATLPPPQKEKLAALLRDVLGRIKACLHDPSYNYYLHAEPINVEDTAYAQFLSNAYHWHIEIIPKLTTGEGYERGAGFHMVRTDPAVAARYLREAAYVVSA